MANTIKRLVTRFDPEFPIDKINLNDRNPNEGDVGAITTALESYGFFGAVLAREPKRKGGRVDLFAGEHRIRGMVAEGETTIPVLFHDRGLSDDDLMRMLLQDNESTRRGRNRDSDLAEILIELADTDIGLLGTGFDGDDLDLLLADPPPLEPPDEFPEIDPDNLDFKYRCPSCNYEWSGKQA